MADDRKPRYNNDQTDRTAAESSASAGWWLKFWVLLPLVLSYLVELIFTIWELDKQVMKKRFIFFDGWVYEDGSAWDGLVSDSSFVYGFMETSSRGLIFVSAAIASWYGVRMNIFFVCITLEIIDGFDYWLFYNHKWFDTHIEFNYIKIALIFFYTWREFITSPRQQ